MTNHDINRLLQFLMTTNDVDSLLPFLEYVIKNFRIIKDWIINVRMVFSSYVNSPDFQHQQLPLKSAINKKSKAFVTECQAFLDETNTGIRLGDEFRKALVHNLTLLIQSEKFFDKNIDVYDFHKQIIDYLIQQGRDPVKALNGEWRRANAFIEETIPNETTRIMILSKTATEWRALTKYAKENRPNQSVLLLSAVALTIMSLFLLNPKYVLLLVLIAVAGYLYHDHNEGHRVGTVVAKWHNTFCNIENIQCVWPVPVTKKKEPSSINDTPLARQRKPKNKNATVEVKSDQHKSDPSTTITASTPQVDNVKYFKVNFGAIPRLSDLIDTSPKSNLSIFFSGSSEKIFLENGKYRYIKNSLERSNMFPIVGRINSFVTIDCDDPMPGDVENKFKTLLKKGISISNYGQNLRLESKKNESKVYALRPL